MNWTGGSLQRSKANPKGVLQRQKVHFARARISPRRPTVFQDGEYNIQDRPPPPGFEPVQDSSHSRFPYAQAASPKPTSSNHRKRKCDEATTDGEERLLEMRRKRLLRQHDWAGLTRAKPANLTFPSAEEKRMLGKRRKLDDGRIRPIKTRLGTPSRRQGKNGSRCGPYMSGALAAEDISIRFGSDALTCPVPRAESSGASSWSEEMLFDDEAMYAEPVVPSARSGDGDEAWVEDVRRSPRDDRGQVSGVFERRDQHVQDGDETEGGMIGQTSHEQAARNTKTGLQQGGMARRAVINDEALWRCFDPSSHAGSSTSTDSDGRATGALMYPSVSWPAGDMKQTRADWSQHGTQGNMTHRSCSVSSSLPSITRCRGIRQ